MITEIAYSHHRLPLDPPFPAAWDPAPRRAFPVALVRIRDESGVEGFGAGDPLRGLADYEDLFIGSDPDDLERHGAVLDNIAFLDGRPWPFETALWDLVGKLRGTPIWQMLGGHTDRLPLYASFGTHRSPSATAEKAAAVAERGFGAVKLRFGRPDPADDLEVLDAVREAVGEAVEIMVDCNQGWRMPWDTSPAWDVDQAVRMAAELEARHVAWMEEPLHRGDHAGMAALRARTTVRIAGGEMTREMHEFDLMLERGCLDVYQPDAAVTGGIGGLSRLAHRVAASGHVFSPHTWGSGVGLVANAHLAAGTVGTPFLEYPLDPPEWTESRRDFLLSEPVACDGEIVLGDAPGLGLELDEERCRATASRVATYS